MPDDNDMVEQIRSSDRPLDLTVQQVAHEMQVHPQTVRGWLKGGHLTFVQVGGRSVRIRQKDLDAFKERGGLPIGRPRKLIAEDTKGGDKQDE